MVERLIQHEAQPGTRVVVSSHVLNDTNAHYVFYCDFVGASELGPAAVAGCFLAKAHHPRAVETNACCAATRSRWTSSTRSICVLARTFLTLYYTIEFNKSNIERSILFIQYASHITGSYSTGGSFDPPTQVTINNN